MSILEEALVFVDIETNGLSAIGGRIIEVAAIRVEGGQISRSFNSLVDPGRRLPPFISRLTGINDEDLSAAPTFADIAEELHEVMDRAVFVAHNVHFDYSFLRHEFARLNKPFSPKLLCTLKLSRAMYPAERGHKLQDLIERCNLAAGERHRAHADADVMRQFICHLQDNFPAELTEKAIYRQIKAAA
jgi:DNA polymerase-3 subunit epsilon